LKKSDLCGFSLASLTLLPEIVRIGQSQAGFRQRFHLVQPLSRDLGNPAKLLQPQVSFGATCVLQVRA
jgi:hypothetical protein